MRSARLTSEKNILNPLDRRRGSNRKRQECRPSQYLRLGHPARWATIKLSMLKTMAQIQQKILYSVTHYRTPSNPVQLFSATCSHTKQPCSDIWRHIFAHQATLFGYLAPHIRTPSNPVHLFSATCSHTKQPCSDIWRHISAYQATPFGYLAPHVRTPSNPVRIFGATYSLTKQPRSAI